MPQKAYKRRPPRAQRLQPPQTNGGFSMPRDISQPYDPIMVKDPHNPDLRYGRVSCRREVEALGRALRNPPVMHILFIDRRSGTWMRIDFPED